MTTTNCKRPGSFFRGLFKRDPVLSDKPAQWKSVDPKSPPHLNASLRQGVKQKAALALVLSSHEKGYSTLTPAVELIVREALGL